MHNGISVGYFNTLHRAGGRAVDLGGGAKFEIKHISHGLQKSISLLIEGTKHVEISPLGAGLDLTTKISEPFICIMLFRNADSPNRQSKQPFHHEFISDFHMDYDVGLTSNNSSLAVNKDFDQRKRCYSNDLPEC